MASDHDAPGYVPNACYSQDDWNAVSDSPEATDEQMARARPVTETMPELVATWNARRSERDGATERVTLRIDRDILPAFRESGTGWQTRLNAMLRDALQRSSAPSSSPR